MNNRSLELNSEILGEESAPDFLILHGLFGSSSNWRSIAKRLQDRYQVHLLDLRNHGQSPWADSMSYSDMASDVLLYTQNYNISSPIILGHSMGGKTLMTLLLNNSIRPLHSFVVDIAPVAYSHDHDSLIQAMQSLDLETVQSRQQADEQLSLSINSAAIRQFLLQNLKRQDGLFQWRINLDAISQQKPSIFGSTLQGQYDDKVIFIRGAQSDYVLPGYHGEIFKCFAYAEIETIENAGHWLHAEQPEKLIQIIDNYVR